MRRLRHQTIRLLVPALACAIGLFAASPCAVAKPASSSSGVTQQVAAARDRIAEMQQNLSASMSSYESAADQLTQTRAALAECQGSLGTLEASIQQGQQRLQTEVAFLYRTDGGGYVEALLGSSSFEQFADRLLALSRIASRDAELLGRIKRDRAEAQRLRGELVAREERQAAALKDVEERRTQAQTALGEQQRYADSLSSKVAATLQAQQNAGRRPPPGSPAPKHAKSASRSRAQVEGRPGTYAVLAGQPLHYTPTGITFRGVATWYGNVRSNMRTSSGRAFDASELTCAHRTLPFGTRVAVTYRGRRVIVTVTDRGPYGRGRVIDITERAASIIGLRSAGVGRVTCEVVRPTR